MHVEHVGGKGDTACLRDAWMIAGDEYIHGDHADAQ